MREPILAIADGSAQDATAFAAAAAAAKVAGTDARAVFCAPDPAETLVWIGDGFTASVGASALTSAREAIEEIKHKINTLATQHGLAFSFYAATPDWALSHLVSLADFCVVGRDALKPKAPLSIALGALMHDHHASLLIADDHPNDYHCLAIAWDASIQAGRAVRAARAWLAKAERICILQAPMRIDRDAQPFADPQILAMHIQRWGGPAPEIRSIAAQGEIGASLMQEAESYGAGALIAGAYGHPRVQEMIFGGATRSFSKAERPIALLMSH